MKKTIITLVVALIAIVGIAASKPVKIVTSCGKVVYTYSGTYKDTRELLKAVQEIDEAYCGGGME